MKTYDLVIIGGGSAGMAAAYSAWRDGVRNILILERDAELGGILLQCIHNGFGLHRFKEELAGPAYAEKWMDMLREISADSDLLEYKAHAMVTRIGEDRIVEYVQPEEGYQQLQAKAVILAMGCRERTRGAIGIPGYRPAGIWTAGTAQRYLNMDGYLVGRKVFILGSGDIGLIMARRMTLEGAEVLGVAELMPYSNGLPRNQKQCLEDFDIPLFLSHTITDIGGKNRVNSVTIAEVDEKRQPVPGTGKRFEVDTILLSVGLIPENTLSEAAGTKLDPRTNGPVVSESYETTVPGIFACGNVLHVHDLVDYVSEESERAGAAAARYIRGELKNHSGFRTQPGDGIGYIVPQQITAANLDKEAVLLYRVRKPYKNVILELYRDGVLWKQIKKKHLAPAEMERLILKKEELEDIKGELQISIREEVPL